MVIPGAASPSRVPMLATAPATVREATSASVRLTTCCCSSNATPTVTRKDSIAAAPFASVAA